MLTAFLASLAFGAVLVGFSFIAGSHGDADAHGGPDHDVPGHDAEAAHDAAPDDAGQSHGPALDAPLAAAAPRAKRRPPLLSLRTVSFFCLAFGASGSALAALGVGAVLALACALGSGLAVWAAAWGIHAWLLASQSGEVAAVSLLGRAGTVVVAVGRDAKGRIQVARDDGTLPLTAVAAPWSRRARFEPGETVVVVAGPDAAGVVQVGEDADLQG